jgi:hypothetical protein
MSLVTILLVVILAGVAWYLISIAPFIGQPFKSIAQWLIIVCVVVWVVSILVGWDILNVRIGRVR